MGLLKPETAPPKPDAGVPTPGAPPGAAPPAGAGGAAGPAEPGASPFGAFFSKKPVAAAPAAGASKELAENVMNAARRLRMLESRNDNMRKKVQFIEQNMLENQKKLTTEIKANQMEMLEIKRGFIELQSRVRMLVKEIQLRAGKEDVDVLKKYLSFWEPIKFVTIDQIDQIIDEKLHKSTDL
ncbi:MAG: hypothetical protein ACE5FT_03155 [Candidatus Nanoarchaeia archaeon]